MQSFKWLNWKEKGKKREGRVTRAMFADINLLISTITLNISGLKTVTQGKTTKNSKQHPKMDYTRRKLFRSLFFFSFPSPPIPFSFSSSSFLFSSSSIPLFLSFITLYNPSCTTLMGSVRSAGTNGIEMSWSKTHYQWLDKNCLSSNILSPKQQYSKLYREYSPR